MTWNETEGLVNECIKQNLSKNELENIANNLPFFDCCNFVIIANQKGLNVSI
jgi:hypothetical protein